MLGTAALCFLLAGAVAVTEFLAPTFTFALSQGSIAPELGFAHLWLVPDVGPIYRLLGDDGSDPDASTLQVFEDGLALGPAHAMHEDIRKLGHGRFSHWTTSVRFSASDNSDPAVNGKHYTAWAASTLSARMAALGLAAFLGGALLFVAWARTGAAATWVRFRRGVDALNRWGCAPLALSVGKTVGLVLAGGALGVAAVIFGWLAGSGTQIGLELARFFPLSDAMAYHGCGTELAAWGRFQTHADFCARRVLYPSMLASLLPAVGWSAQNALVAQGFLLGLAGALLTLQIARVMSAAAATAAGAMLAVFVWEFTLGVFMTEVAGFMMGALGLTLLLAFSESNRSLWLFAGLTFLSTAMVSRAGALAVIPAAVLWAAIVLWRDVHFRRSLLFAIAGGAVGPALQFALVWFMGQDPTNTGGNFSATLYGMSTGSRTWTEAYEHFRVMFASQPEAAVHKVIYAAAIRNILDRPDVFVQSLTVAFSTYWRQFFAVGELGHWSTVLWALFILGLVRSAICFQTSRTMSLLLLLFLGEVATAPLIGNDAGVRALAASIAIRFAICAVGLHALLHLVMRALGGLGSPQAPGGDALPKLGGAVGMLVVWMMMLPLLPFSRYARLDTVEPTGRCVAGLNEVISRIGEEAIMITVTRGDERLQSFDPMRVSHQRLTEDYGNSWYAPEIMRLRPPVTMMHAFDRSTHGRGGSLRFVAYQGMLEETDEPRILCVDLANSVKMADGNYAVIRDIQRLHP